MSIWNKEKPGHLQPYSYKKSLIHAEDASIDSTIVWLEGVDYKMKSRVERFGICGGPINTNTGVMFTRENLQEILDNLPEGGLMKVAGCNQLILNNKIYTGETVYQEFEKDNDMVQISPNSFCPSKNVKDNLK